MKLVKISENIFEWMSEKPSRDHSYIADIDLKDHCPEFWLKCYEIESNCGENVGQYREWQHNLIRSILEFYDDWEFITWKQYDTVFKMYPIKPPSTISRTRSRYKTTFKTGGYLMDDDECTKGLVAAMASTFFDNKPHYLKGLKVN